jgi:hypothetical protein
MIEMFEASREPLGQSSQFSDSTICGLNVGT